MPDYITMIYKIVIFLTISSIGQNVHGAATDSDCTPVNTQNLMTNGGFEKPRLEPNEYYRQTYDISGWSVSGGAIGEVMKEGHASRQKLELASTHGYKITQPLNIKLGKRYALRFWSKYRTLAYNQLNILLKGYPNEACGTANNFTVTVLEEWQEYSYILCPNSNRVTLEFSQQRETGGGYGVHLDDISLVPCTANQSSPSKSKFLTQTWVHSYEEDHGSITVWRKARSKPFPSSRFRRTITFYSGGQCQFLYLSSNDTHHQKACQWNFNSGNNKLDLREPTGQIAGNYQVKDLSQDLLSINK